MDVLLALDIGGTKVAAGLVTREGMVVDRGRIAVRSNQSDENLFSDVAQLVDSMLTKARGQHGAQPVALGVGCAGPMTENAELVSPLNIPCWRDFPLVPQLRSLTGLPVFADGDAKALALGEGWKGAAKGHDNFLAMVVSTGVGGGIVLNGRLLDGASGNAGHIGHVIVEPSGRRCVCGARGCLEAETSGPAIEAITGRPPTQPTYEIIQRTGRLVGRGIASVCNLLDLPLAVVGGSVALGFGAPFFQAAQNSLDELCRLEFSTGARIVPARLGDDGALIGAAAFALRGMNRMTQI
ncbi:MAG: ROK family protein [Ilumatobacteraceae bacterium]|nr:ROK family protein [Ilumatobacteraceae bacterium]